MVSALLPLLNSPLPRCWRNLPGSIKLAEPLPMDQTHHGMGPAIGSPDLYSARINDALDRFVFQSSETIRAPLLKWISAYDAASSSLPELMALSKEVDVLREKVRRAEASYFKTLRYDAIRGGGGGGVPEPNSSGGGGCTSFFSHTLSCKSRSKSMDKLSNPLVADPVGGEGVDLITLHRGVPISLELKEDEASIKVKNRIKQLEAVSDAHEAMENTLNEQFSGLCCDSEWLKSYMVSHLLMLKDFSQELLTFLGPSLPLSASLGPSASPNGDPLHSNTVTSKEKLIQDMPSFLADPKVRRSIIDSTQSYKTNPSTSPLARQTTATSSSSIKTRSLVPQLTANAKFEPNSSQDA